MTDMNKAVEATIERVRSDLGGWSLAERIEMEILRLRGEGQTELADAVAARLKAGVGQ